MASALSVQAALTEGGEAIERAMGGQGLAARGRWLAKSKDGQWRLQGWSAHRAS
jgi:hypothetical protein